jgi:HD-GYP domain-containing protein (c-di-GMP phosphodiesterase class II)
VLHNIVASRDVELAHHGGRVARLADRVATGLQFPGEQNAALIQAAYLHDVGKLSLPEDLLAKPSALSPEQWKLVKRHTVIGEQILAAAGAPVQCAIFVRSSHERFDGAGYPDGLLAEQIPLGARIIAVCDSYDAMTSSRPYRPRPMSDEAALTELRDSSGTQFDPTVVEAVCVLPVAERAEL